MAGEKKTTKAATAKSFGNVGRVLVIGGNGFLGHHIVNQLLGETWTASHVSSVDLRCDRNRNEAATYRECDITDADKLQSVLEELKPDVVVHTASPVALDGNKARELLRRVNVEGTRSVVQACQQAGVKALVYTASASVISDGVNGLYNADERWPVLRHSQQKDYYAETKAHAEEIVLKANREEPSKLLTCSIRPAGLFGEGDVQLGAGYMNAYRGGKDKIQIGDNTNLFDFTYIGNVAHAHLLAAHRLLATAQSAVVPLDHERVDGEAFFITNDAPVYFWDFSRAFYRAFGSTKDYRNGVWVLNDTIAYFFGACSELVATVMRTSPNFTTQVVTISGMTRYYNIGKAKRVLGYTPQWTLQEGVDRAAKWLLELEKSTGKQEGVPRGRKA